MKKTVISLLPAIALIFEILPYGTKLTFASGVTERIDKTFSYFSLIPFGYADFAPLCTAVLTCIVLLLSLFSTKVNKLYKAVFAVSLIAALVSLLPLIYGYYTIIGGIISALLLTETIFAKILK